LIHATPSPRDKGWWNRDCSSTQPDSYLVGKEPSLCGQFQIAIDVGWLGEVPNFIWNEFFGNTTARSQSKLSSFKCPTFDV
jgi:hypothetical protein